MKAKHFLLLLLFCLPFSIFAQDSFVAAPGKKAKKKKKATVFEALVNNEETPKWVLTTDIKALIRNKFSIETLPTKLEVHSNGSVETWDVELRTRGKSRKRICYMPPLKLEFPKDDLEAKGIRKKFNDLKLVSYCRDRNNYEGFVVKEYLAYKLYNIITDYSFNVQLVEIEYRDEKGKIAPVKRHGFIIENTDEMANRLNAKEKNKYMMHRDSMDHFQYDVLALFQYMISNTDWKIHIMHNIKVIKDKDTDEYYAVPYDFDYSGFVNTLYSVPNPDVNQMHVRERVFMGECRSAKELQPAREWYLSKKDEIMSYYEELPLSKKDYKRTMKYLKGFFKTLSSDKKFKKRCLKEKKRTS